MGNAEKVIQMEDLKHVIGQVFYQNVLVQEVERHIDKKEKPFYNTRLSVPALDQHSHPQTLKVFSRDVIGHEGEIVESIICRVTTRHNNGFVNHGLEFVTR